MTNSKQKTHEDIVAESYAKVVWNYKGEDVTRGELWKLHKLVESPEGWKMPIDAVVELSDRDLDLLDYAIVFFSGCSAEFYEVEGQPKKTRVIADGYYRSVGA